MFMTDTHIDSDGCPLADEIQVTGRHTETDRAQRLATRHDPLDQDISRDDVDEQRGHGQSFLLSLHV